MRARSPQVAAGEVELDAAEQGCRPRTRSCPSPGLREVAEWNPVSAVVAAVRTLFGSNPTAVPADAAWPLQHLAAVGWSLLILAVVAPLCVLRFRGRGGGVALNTARP